MTQKTTRPPKVRAIEKLQTILSRGARDGAKGYDHFFWRDGVAVLRSAYDLSASKPGSLVLNLGDKNTIVSIEHDDAGPVWDCNDEHSMHWMAINEWATDMLNKLARKHVVPRAAESIFNCYGLAVVDLLAKSHAMMREMAMDQWQEKPALKVVVDRLFPAGILPETWLHNAQYLSETLILEKTAPQMDFQYKGLDFDSNCMLPWLLVVTFEEAARQCTQNKFAMGAQADTVYTRARLQRKQENNETLYDWRIYTQPEQQNDLFAGPFHVRVVLESKFGIFNHIRIGRKFHQMSALERGQCIQTMYDIVNGHELPLTQEQSYRIDCERLASIKNDGSLKRMSPSEIANALRVIFEEWWPKGTQGYEMLNSIQALYPWEHMKKATPHAALDLLTDMGSASEPMMLDVSMDATGQSLFEPS